MSVLNRIPATLPPAKAFLTPFKLETQSLWYPNLYPIDTSFAGITKGDNSLFFFVLKNEVYLRFNSNPLTSSQMEIKTPLVGTETWRRTVSYSSMMKKGATQGGDHNARTVYTNAIHLEYSLNGRDTNMPFH